MPSSVVITGMPVFSASMRTSVYALPMITPCPTISSGRSAAAMRRGALRTPSSRGGAAPPAGGGSRNALLFLSRSRVTIRERADAEQRRDHRDAGLLCQHAHFGIRVADDHPVPHHQQRPLGGGDEAGRLAHAFVRRGRDAPGGWGLPERLRLFVA